jgi:hypothetical protein
LITKVYPFFGKIPFLIGFCLNYQKNSTLLLYFKPIKTNLLFSNLKKDIQFEHTRINMNTNKINSLSGPPSNFDKEKYEKALIDQLDSIKRWHDLPEFDQLKYTTTFMDKIGNLFLEYYQDHLDEARSCGQLYKASLEPATTLITDNYILHAANEITSADTAWEDPWELACQTRTNIEAFNAMFGEIVNHLKVDADLEEFMEKCQGSFYLSRKLIPNNVPISHWWWFSNSKTGDKK